MAVFFFSILGLVFCCTNAEKGLQESSDFVDNFKELLIEVNGYKKKFEDVEARLAALTEECEKKDDRIISLENELSIVKKLVKSSAQEIGQYALHFS